MRSNLKVLALASIGISLIAGQFNPITYPPCSTAYSLVNSCVDKVGEGDWVTAPLDVAYSCLCYNSGGTYDPTVWDDTAGSCTDIIKSFYSTASFVDPFGSYAAGFCTNTMATTTGEVVSTTLMTGTTVTSTASTPTVSRPDHMDGCC